MKKPSKKISGFNILNRGPEIVHGVQEHLIRTAAGANRNIILAPGGEAQRLLVPIGPFPLQYAVNVRGLISGTILDVLGDTGIGKSTLLYHFFGWGAAGNCPSMLVESENKPVDRDRAERCLHPNREKAKQLYDTITQTQAFEILEAIDQIETWLAQIRNPGRPEIFVPYHVPAIVGLDSFSKLMAPHEAAGFDAYSDAPKRKKKSEAGKPSKKEEDDDEVKAKGIGEVSNMVHAQLAHGWTRRLARMLAAYNAILILVRHQNDKVDMGGAVISKSVKDTYQDTSRGGRAFPQSSACRFILSQTRFVDATIRGNKEKVAKIIKMNVMKNSYGPDRTIQYYLNLVPRTDTDLTHEMALDFDLALPSVLQASGMFSIKYHNAQSYTCDQLKMSEVTPADLAARFYSDRVLYEATATRMGIRGYGPRYVMPAINEEIAEGHAGILQAVESEEKARNESAAPPSA